MPENTMRIESSARVRARRACSRMMLPMHLLRVTPVLP